MLGSLAWSAYANVEVRRVPRRRCAADYERERRRKARTAH